MNSMKANQRAHSVVLVRKRASFIAGLCITLTILSGSAFAQLGPYDRDSARSMLEAVRDDLKKNYYDAELHGLNLEICRFVRLAPNMFRPFPKMRLATSTGNTSRTTPN